jgi:hypothetical protein
VPALDRGNHHRALAHDKKGLPVQQTVNPAFAGMTISELLPFSSFR